MEKLLKDIFNDLIPPEFGGMQEPLLSECEKISIDFAVNFGKWLESTKTLNTGVPIHVLLKMFMNQYGYRNTKF